MAKININKPTETALRLPVERKRKIIKVGWDEYTQHEEFFVGDVVTLRESSTHGQRDRWKETYPDMYIVHGITSANEKRVSWPVYKLKHFNTKKKLDTTFSGMWLDLVPFLSLVNRIITTEEKS